MAKGEYYGGLLGWSVGIESWLDSTKAGRYWRAIENGTDYFVGKNIVGLWGGLRGQFTARTAFGDWEGEKLAPYWGKGELGNETAMLRGARAALWVYMGRGRGSHMDLFRTQPGRKDRQGHAMSERKQQKAILFFLMKRATLTQIPFTQGVIRQKIPAAHYYTKAIQTFDPAARELALLREELERNGWLKGRDRTKPAADIMTSVGLQRARAFIADGSGRDKPSTGPRWASPNQQYGAFEVNVTASAVLQDFSRVRGKFANVEGQGIVHDINQRVAKEFQEHLVQVMENDRKRPATREFVRASADRNNRYPR
jgi:hypothetical protein